MKIEDVGDTEFLVDEQVDKFRFLEENERVITAGGRPAQGRPLAPHGAQTARGDPALLLGITKASLSTDSFISAASFRRGGGDDARAHRSVHLRQGRSLARPEGERDDGPADTGGDRLRVLPQRPHSAGRATAAAGAAQPSDDELELERDLEYFVEPDDVPLAPRTGDLGE